LHFCAEIVGKKLKLDLFFTIQKGGGRDGHSRIDSVEITPKYQPVQSIFPIIIIYIHHQTTHSTSPHTPT